MVIHLSAYHCNHQSIIKSKKGSLKASKNTLEVLEIASFMTLEKNVSQLIVGAINPVFTDCARAPRRIL